MDGETVRVTAAFGFIVHFQYHGVPVIFHLPILDTDISSSNKVAQIVGDSLMTNQ